MNFVIHMINNAPKVSVIIPAYNQAAFLMDAVESAINQAYQDIEIIVVNDGSTDTTADIASHYGDRIRYIYQENRGLAGARNTGIKAARGSFIALLDSDDIWTPNFLQKMMQLAAEKSEAVVFYCSARYCDAEGNELPQIIECESVPDESLFEKLATANFIIPSTVVMNKAAIIDVGLFDENFRACEDWDLWLRLAPTKKFACLNECLIKYRLHGTSLSTDPGKMQRAVKAVIEKHFGPEDDDLKSWTKIKHTAYGGVYRYHAWTSVLRKNDWDACALSLRQALRVNPVTSKEIDFFYDLALGSQPLGYRGTPERLELELNAVHMEQMLSKAFDGEYTSFGKPLENQTYGTAYFALGLIAYNIGRFSLSRHYLIKALRFRPDLWKEKRVGGSLLKSFLSPPIINWIKKIRSTSKYENIISH